MVFKAESQCYRLSSEAAAGGSCMESVMKAQERLMAHNDRAEGETERLGWGGGVGSV